MHIVIAPFQIKDSHREHFIEEMIEDARGSLENEPGCLRFDIIQDPEDPNRIWLYEIYRDKQAFQQHIETPHFKKWRDTVQDWQEDRPMSPVIGGSRIWPPDTKS